MIRYALPFALFASPVFAGQADVIAAKATNTGGTTWQVDATVEHADEGWDHYANAFEVLEPDGKVLETRKLFHPHVNEQPFTRSVSVTVPDGVSQITVRAVDSVHGRGGAEVTVDLTQ